MKCDIIIVNWNSGGQLREAVESIRRFGGAHVERTIVVDNGSVDGSAAFIRQAADTCLIELDSNRGFGAACNIGAAEAHSDFLLFLNPDARLVERTVPSLAAAVDDPAHEHVGVFGVQLFMEDGRIQRSCARFPGPGTFVMASLGLDRLASGNSLHMHDWDHRATRAVDHVIGAFYLIRRSLFTRLGGFDERFFVYLEDLDLSLRVREAGFPSLYLASSVAFHKGGGVSEKVKAQRLFYSLRSRILYAGKHFTPVPAFAVAAVTLGPELLTRALFLAARGAFGEMGDLLRGYRMLWKWAIASRLGRRHTSLDGGI